MKPRQLTNRPNPICVDIGKLTQKEPQTFPFSRPIETILPVGSGPTAVKETISSIVFEPCLITTLTMTNCGSEELQLLPLNYINGVHCNISTSMIIPTERRHPAHTPTTTTTCRINSRAQVQPRPHCHPNPHSYPLLLFHCIQCQHLKVHKDYVYL